MSVSTYNRKELIEDKADVTLASGRKGDTVTRPSRTACTLGKVTSSARRRSHATVPTMSMGRPVNNLEVRHGGVVTGPGVGRLVRLSVLAGNIALRACTQSPGPRGLKLNDPGAPNSPRCVVFLCICKIQSGTAA